MGCGGSSASAVYSTAGAADGGPTGHQCETISLYLDHLFAAEEYSELLTEALASLRNHGAQTSKELSNLKDVVKQFCSPPIKLPQLRQRHSSLPKSTAADFKRLKLDPVKLSDTLVETKKRKRNMASDLAFMVDLIFTGRTYDYFLAPVKKKFSSAPIEAPSALSRAGTAVERLAAIEAKENAKGMAAKQYTKSQGRGEKTAKVDKGKVAPSIHAAKAGKLSVAEFESQMGEYIADGHETEVKDSKRTGKKARDTRRRSSALQDTDDDLGDLLSQAKVDGGREGTERGKRGSYSVLDKLRRDSEEQLDAARLRRSWAAAVQRAVGGRCPAAGWRRRRRRRGRWPACGRQHAVGGRAAGRVRQGAGSALVAADGRVRRSAVGHGAEEACRRGRGAQELGARDLSERDGCGAVPGEWLPVSAQQSFLCRCHGADCVVVFSLPFAR